MIRDVTSDDRQVFLEIAREFYSSRAVEHPIENHVVEATVDAALSKSPFVRLMLIEDCGKPVGFGVLAFTHATEVGGLVVLIEDLYINDSCRGKGIGGEFMSFVEREYPHAKRFRLEVAPGNVKAISLYERLGYKKLNYVQMVKDI